jgi:uncharacterized protein with GYD domain
MAHFIVTGNYTNDAIKGMVAHPSDREAAARALVEAAGGKVQSYYMTTGDKDFLMIAKAKDGIDVIASLLVAGASGTVSNLRTVRGFTSAEFTSAQKKASAIAATYLPANSGVLINQT